LVDITNAGDESNENNNYVSVPLTVVPGRPVILAEGGVVNAASFLPGAASAAWITIFGANLAPSTRLWGESDFVDNKLPTQLDGVSVNINGKPGYLYYISPTQINVLAPDDPAQGPIEVEVITALGRSDPVVAQKDWVSPAFFMLYPEEQKYVAAVHVDGTYVGKAGLFEGALPTRPVKPGDVIMLFGNGFGPTDPSWPTEELVGEAAPLSIPVTVRIGGSSAIVHFAGLVSSGLYQFNVTIPEVPDGDQPVVAGVAGFHSQDGAFITVQR
jgi:uncharacterized protein (TIGR03437 family)